VALGELLGDLLPQLAPRDGNYRTQDAHELLVALVAEQHQSVRHLGGTRQRVAHRLANQTVAGLGAPTSDGRLHHALAATKIAISGRAQSSRTKSGGPPLDPYFSLIRNAVPVSVPAPTPPRRLPRFHHPWLATNSEGF